MKKILMIFIALAVTAGATAQKKTFVRDYVYQGSERDSKVDARAAAIREMTVELLREIGFGIYSETTLKRLSIIKDGKETFSEEFSKKIVEITAGVVNVVVDKNSERWDGTTCKFHIEDALITVDTSEVRKQIAKLLSNKEEMANAERERDEAVKKLAQAIRDKEKAEQERDKAIKDKEKAEGKTKPTESKPFRSKERMFYEYLWSEGAPIGLLTGYASKGILGGYVSGKLDGRFIAKNTALYLGDEADTRLALTGGAMLHLTDWLYWYIGAGYGEYAKGKSGYLHTGAEVESGVMLCWDWFNVSAGYGALLTTGKAEPLSQRVAWRGAQVGVGFNFYSGEYRHALNNFYSKEDYQDVAIFVEYRGSKTSPVGLFVGGGKYNNAFAKYSFIGVYGHLGGGDRYYLTLGPLLGFGPLLAYGGIGGGTAKYSGVTKPLWENGWVAAGQYEYGVKLKVAFVNFSVGRSHMRGSEGFAEWHFGIGSDVCFPSGHSYYSY